MQTGKNEKLTWKQQLTGNEQQLPQLDRLRVLGNLPSKNLSAFMIIISNYTIHMHSNINESAKVTTTQPIPWFNSSQSPPSPHQEIKSNTRYKHIACELKR